ncbi:MAG: lipopolysaccharide assembly protein LapA domain-containing protein [Candidatus Rokuibacteriota bacterium]
MIIIYLLMALLGSMATVFAFQNLEPPVEIRFLVWSVTGMPLALVILLSLLLGIVFASLSGLMKVLKLRYRVRQLEAQVSQLIAAQTPSPSSPHAPQGPTLPA